MSEDDDTETVNFHHMELDERILKDIAKLGWMAPTLVQEKAIPLLLEGKDMLMKARTGTGKTAAYAIPLVQNILRIKFQLQSQETLVVILAPTLDLCHQITKVMRDLTVSFGTLIRCADLSAKTESTAHVLTDRADIVISTPGKLLAQLRAGTVCLKESLRCLVIDEADLMFSYGYEEDLDALLAYLPSTHQSILCSATLEDDVVALKQRFLHNAVVLKLQESEMANPEQLTHYKIAAEEEDKAAILYTLLKLQLLQGKCIIFVQSVVRCYRLKLFLDQFKIRSCVLNSELPIRIRCHTVKQFNQNMYDIIIASDEAVAVNPAQQPKQSSKKKSVPLAVAPASKEFGISRGIDFQCVTNVINFDFPVDTKSYVHRAGRTARGDNQGNVLSFVAQSEFGRMRNVEAFMKQIGHDTANPLRHFQFNLEQVAPFRYRARDAWRATTKLSIREARIKELKAEIFNSEKLKSFFEDNPRELQTLRHDRTLHTVRQQDHLGDVPEYLVPESLRHIAVLQNKKQNRKRNDNGPVKRKSSKADNPLLMEGLDYRKKSRI